MGPNEGRGYRRDLKASSRKDKEKLYSSLTTSALPPTLQDKGRITHPTAPSEPRKAAREAVYRSCYAQSTLWCVPITDEDIRRFQEIWREEFQEEITADEARDYIARLDELYLILLDLPPRSEDTEDQ